MYSVMEANLFLERKKAAEKLFWSKCLGSSFLTNAAAIAAAAAAKTHGLCDS